MHAQEETLPSPDPVTQTLKERVQQVLEKQDGSVAGVQTLASNTFGFVGTLDKIVGSTLQITTFAGDSRIAELDKTAVVTRQGKLITHEEIELNSTIIATGVKDTDDSYKIKKMSLVTDTIFPTKRQTILGIYASLTTRSILFTPTGSGDGLTTTTPITTRTSFLDILGNKIDRKLLKAPEQIVVVLPEQTTSTVSAIRVYKLSAEQSTLIPPIKQ